LSEIEARNLDGAVKFYHDSAVTQVNDGLPLRTKGAVQGLLQRYFENFAQVEHELLNAFGVDTQFAAEMLCYTGGVRQTRHHASHGHLRARRRRAHSFDAHIHERHRHV
jgi:hypothetical protein